MTQMEKSLNKGDLQGYKANDNQLNAMVPGIFSESPLRNAVSATRNDSASSLKPSKIGASRKMNLIAAQKAEYDDVMMAAVKQSQDGHYNTNAPPGHWRP